MMNQSIHQTLRKGDETHTEVKDNVMRSAEQTGNIDPEEQSTILSHKLELSNKNFHARAKKGTMINERTPTKLSGLKSQLQDNNQHNLVRNKVSNMSGNQSF